MAAEISKSVYSFAAPDELKVNMLSRAYGVPRESLSFSWVMHSNDVGDIQTGYRILVANRLSDLQEESYLLDTGWIASDENTDVTIAGLDTLLGDNELYYWSVQLRNKRGAESAWSTPAPFTTAVGHDWEDTRGIWCDAQESAARACMLRAEFKMNDMDTVEKATVSVTALSPEPARQYVCQLMLNGQCIGMLPAPLGRGVGGEQLIYYHTYDVTEQLSSGTNVLAAINSTTEEKLFLCQLTVFYKSGAKSVLLNSARDVESFTAMDATSIYASGRSIVRGTYVCEAEDIDGARYPFGFDRPGFEGVWSPAQLRHDVEVEQESVLTPYPGEPMLRFLHDVAQVEQIGRGHYLIDLGQEIIGTLRVDVALPQQTTVRVFFGEELDEYGAVRYRLRAGSTYYEQWTLPAGMQSVEGFGMKAFRFVEILDCPVELTEQNVHGVALRGEFDAQDSSFACSNDVLCALYDTYKYAVCATQQLVYTDAPCANRTLSETGAMLHMLASYTYLSDVALPRFSLEHMLSNRARVKEFGLLSVHLVRLDYLYSGNATLLRRYYPLLKKMVMAREADEQTGLFPCPTDEKGTPIRFAVDEPESACDDYRTEQAHYHTVYNAVCYTALRDMTVMASVLGKEDEATQFRAQADRLRNQMITWLYDASRGAFRDGLTADGQPIDHFAQHATAYALNAGVYADDQMKDTLGRTLIGQDSIRMSIQGAFILLEALYRAGFGAYATALLASEDTSSGAHTFAAALTDGLVTVSPSSWSSREQQHRALCDLRGAAPASLIVRDMIGLRPTRPGFHKFEIRPQLGDLPYASVRVPTVKGTIGVSIGQNHEAYEAEVIVPPNTKATVFLPVLPGGTDTLFVNQQISNFPIEGDCFRIELGSGTHRLLAQ